ncbi:MAG: hypothetical protein OEV43_02180, partial [Coriobacteriia bacterium]|nr:hypothetical protein [Coriobacteriia bacterium]
MVARVRSWYRQHPGITLGVILGVVAVTLLAVWLMPAVAAQETLHPSGAGTTYNQWTVTSSWATDLDASGDSLIGSENTDAQAQALHMDDPTFDPSATINSVTVYAMARTTGNDDFGLGIYDGTNAPVYTTHNVSGTFAQWSSGPYATNPWTSSPWTYADIQGLQVYMVEVKAGGQDSVEVDEVWIVVDYTLVSPTLTVTQGSDTGRPTAKIYRGQSADVAVDELNLAASNGDVTVTQIVVRGLDTVDTLTTDVTSVRLFEDDGDGVWDGGDSQIGSSTTFSGAASGSTATFSGLTYTITSGTSENVWIVYTIGASAVDGHIVGSQVQNGDITVQAGQQVTAFATITSANAGQTIQVDAAAPTANTTDPLNDDVLTGASKTVAGTSSDGAGSGVASVEIRIARDDGQYWNGGGWTGTETWVGATGTTNWTYSWSLDAGQNRQRTYTITARATDNVGLTGTDATPVTGVKVDNTGPTISSATAVDATTVDVLFNEALDGATIAASDFTIAGLTVSGAVLQGDNVTVRLTTTAQTPASPYTVQCAAGNVADVYTNTNPATSANFTGYGSPPVGGALTVSQGADAGRPSSLVYRTRDDVTVVDELVLSASGGDVTVGQIVVRGLDTGGALTTNTSAVRLFEDDGNGIFVDGPDSQVGTTKTFSGDASGSTATFDSLAYTVSDGVTKKLWIVYTIGAAANDGHILGSRVNDGDITPTLGTVDAFADIISANSGQTVQIDASAPTVNTTDPLNDAVLTGAVKQIAGTASDGTGSGLAEVRVRIRRSDGEYWDTDHWSVVEAWNLAAGTTNWTYDWSLDAGQNRESSYEITVQATDNVSLTGTDATPVTNVRVDNIGPSIQSAAAIDKNTVDVTFDEPLDPTTVAGDGSDFTIAGLTITAANVQPGNQVVRLTTSDQSPGTGYTVQIAAGNVDDPYGNPGLATGVGFSGFGTSDTEPPSVPGNVNVVAGAAPPVIATVSWDASTDNVGVVGYKVWRSMTSTGTPILIGSTTLLTFNDTTGIPGQQYFYRVSAYDAASNESAKSGPAGPVTSTWTQAPHTVYTVAGNFCRMCHAPHVATTQSSLMRPTDRAPGELSVCYACHDGQGASTNILAGADNSFALASGHVLEDLEVATDLSNRCSSCHSPHSDYSGEPKLPRETINGDTVSTDDNTWCFACHNDTNDWYGVGYPSTANPTRNATGYPILGTFPGETTYADKDANAHASIPASATARRVFGDCLYCHESHRGPNEFDSLISTFTPTTADTLADDQANGTYASSCLDCHGGTLQSYFTTTPVDIKQFVTAGTSRAGHRIKTAGG